MTRVPPRAPALTALLAAFCVSLPSLASATTLRIQFTGLDLVYDGSSVCDLDGCNGRNGDPADADPLSTMTFGFDNNDDGLIDVPIGFLIDDLFGTDDIFADIELDIANIPVAGGTVTGSGDYFDLLTKDAGAGSYGLGLTIDQWTATYDPNSPTGPLVFFASGTAIGIAAGQDLPFFLADVEIPVEFSFSSQIAPSMLTDDGSFLTGFTASGTGEVSAVLVPEPSAAGLFGLGLLGLAAVGSPRRRRAAH